MRSCLRFDYPTVLLTASLLHQHNAGNVGQRRFALNQVNGERGPKVLSHGLFQLGSTFGVPTELHVGKTPARRHDLHGAVAQRDEAHLVENRALEFVERTNSIEQ